MVRVGINGFGRIGRLVLRAATENEHIQIVAVNDPYLTIEQMRYMLQYDSVHSGFPGRLDLADGRLLINGRKLEVYHHQDPCSIPWAECQAEYVIESSGAFANQDKASTHLRGGARKVIVTAPSSDIPMFVMGVNHVKYESSMDVVSNASCTTNCLAPLAKVVNDFAGIEKGLMTTIHATTSTQRTVDSFSAKDWRGGRSILNNIIPAKTGAAAAIGSVIPELKGKLTGLSFRVPISDVSVVDLTCSVVRSTNLQEICSAIKRASEGQLKGVLGYTEDDVVSSDMIHDPRISIFDAKASLSLDDHFFKLVAWYDNEWGYSCKVLDLVMHMHQTDLARKEKDLPHDDYSRPKAL